jgi:MFS family permease
LCSKLEKILDFETAIFLSASLVTFANILTCIVGGVMGQYFGRKKSMILVAPISIVAFICQALAPNKALLLFGRFLVGVGGGLVSGPCTVRSTLALKESFTT